jgi:hypothetical protein
MRPAFLALLFAVTLPAAAQQQEIHRALIQRDQQSAEFAAQVRGGNEARVRLEALHARQLSDAMVPLSPNASLAAQLLPYQRSRMAEEREGSRELRIAPPIVRAPVPPEERTLPLPGGPRPGVDPVTPQSVNP